MSGDVFTMRFKRVIDRVHGNVSTGANLGLDAYPLFDEGYRAGLNNKIVDHFWNREIGRETIEDFRFALRRTMNEIMPLYNQLYLSERIKIDPLSTMDIRNVNSSDMSNTVDADASSTTEGSGESENLSIGSTFPQSAIKKHTNGEYADNSTEGIGSTVNRGNGTEKRKEKADTTSTGESTTSGYTGPASELLLRYRQTFLNIDLQVIADLNPLFMSIWDTGDTYTESGFIA